MTTKDSKPNFWQKIFMGWDKFEIIMLLLGAALILGATLIFGEMNLATWLDFTAALLTLVWVLAQAQGKPYAHLIGIVATGVYCYCAFVEQLYGEIIIGLVLTIPSCICSYIVWMRNKRNKAEEGEILVVNFIKWRELFLLALSQVVMGVGYYFFLRALGTEQLLFSTFTLATSVMDAYLLLRRTALALYLEVLDNLLTAGLWLMLVIGGNLSGIIFVVQYVFLFLYSFYGAFTWNKYRAEQDAKKKPAQ